MSYHTRTSVLVHYVFSTKNRLPTIPVAIQPRLWSYVGGDRPCQQQAHRNECMLNKERDSSGMVGYGGFAIGVSQISITVDYILNQEKHHAKKSFAEEWKMFLDRHRIVDEED